MVAKWLCKNCHKLIYTDCLEEPSCPYCLFSKVKFVWVDFEPNKCVWDEVKRSGSSIQVKYPTKKDAWRFTAHLYTDSDKEVEEMLNKLPF